MKGLIKNKLFLFALLALSLLVIYSENSNASGFTAPDGTSCDCTGAGYVPSGWTQQGYTTSCRYPLWVCTGPNKNNPSCHSGISSPPSCSPPPEPCGNGVCRSGESCSSCPTDCGRCDPQLSPWCESNCYANNWPASSSHRYCGQGWLQWSNMYCYSAPPPGETCQTCQGGALCGDSQVHSPETCDDGNTATESCSYGQTSCQVCGSSCIWVAGATSFCGDGRIDGLNGELCDDGNTRSGDGCSSNCKVIEAEFGCNGQPSVCSRNPEICFDGIDNNGINGVDENCGGCADLNKDAKVDFDDFFIFADCVSGSGVGGCNAERFSKSDFNDNGRVEAGVFNAVASRSDFNNDGRVDNNDLFIMADNYGASGSAIRNQKTDITRDGVVDLDDWFIFADDYGSVTNPGEDAKCFMQEWTLYQEQGGTYSCETRPQCVTKETFRGGTKGAQHECENSFFCDPDPITGAVCSLGRTGTNPRPGVCCPINTYWDGRANRCQPATNEPCSCSHRISEPAFWSGPTKCINPTQNLACLQTKLFSREPQKRQLEIVKR